ncbi:hypothetical protein [Streptomyces erythrochromogenes]|uniref:hypothetical protein n=1 Tax=Streptomyces erythrochromogenes TaxID=285574 RepID=UPI0037FB9819
MDSTSMPEPLRRAVHQLVSEAVLHCQDVLRYTEPDQAHTWKRMTMYRATDAADTMDMAAQLIAAYCQHAGMSQDTLQTYLQTGQQQSRADGPHDDDRAHVAGLLGNPAPQDGDAAGVRSMYWHGRRQAENAQRPEDDPQKLLTEACLHGLNAKLCDDVDSLDSYLPPQMAAMARKVADALQMPEPATV